MKEKKVIRKLWSVIQTEGGGIIFWCSLKTEILGLLKCALAWGGEELINSPLNLFQFKEYMFSD